MCYVLRKDIKLFNIITILIATPPINNTSETPPYLSVHDVNDFLSIVLVVPSMESLMQFSMFVIFSFAIELRIKVEDITIAIDITVARM